MPITLSNLVANPQQLYGGIYPNRPVWALLATVNGAAPSTSVFYSTFSKYSWYTPQSTEFVSGTNVGYGRSNFFTNEITTSLYLAGSASAQASTNAWNPATGFFGTTSIGQTGADINVDMNDVGALVTTSSANRRTIFQCSGTVIGEPNWNQTYDLIAYNGKIMKLPVMSGVNANVTTPSTNADFFFVSQQMYAGSQYNSPTGVNAGLGFATMTSSTNTVNNASSFRNFGMISHNRNTGKLAYLEATTTTGAYRLHIVDLQNKIGQNTTTSQIKAWIESAVAAGASRYNFYDITLPSLSQAFTVQQLEQVRIVLCDDDTIWAYVWDKNDSSTGGTNRLYSATNTTTYAFTQITTDSTTTSFSVANSGNGVNGVRHMNSDDNSRIALYTQYYYYLAGINCNIVNTATAVTAGSTVQWMRVADQNSSGQVNIVPAGGKGWMLAAPYQNADGAAGAYMGWFDSTVLAGQTQSAPYLTSVFPTVNQSTSYGSWATFKCQPTQEWKPASEGL